MDLYLVGLTSTKSLMDYVKEFNEDKKNKVGVLITFANVKGCEKALAENFEKVMLDSGAYSAFNSGTVIDINKLADFIIANREKITRAVSLDVIGADGWQSVKNWDYLRNERGVDVLPVYHNGDGEDILKYYADRTDYICLGGMAGVTSDWRILVPFLERVFYKYPNTKFHGLGVNDPRLVHRFPFYSVDALSWRSGSRFGQIITPWGRWWIGARNGRRMDGIETITSDINNWLKQYNLEYPLPEDFDYKTLDKINVQILYDMMVMYCEDKEVGKDLSYSDFLF